MQGRGAGGQGRSANCQLTDSAATGACVDVGEGVSVFGVVIYDDTGR